MCNEDIFGIIGFRDVLYRKRSGLEKTIKEGKIVVTIEGDSVGDEIRKMRQPEQLEHVLNVEMIYSYFEDELNEERGKLEIQDNIPDWLNDDNVKAQDIRYKGTL